MMDIKKILLLTISIAFFINCTAVYKTFEYYTVEEIDYIGSIGKLRNENEENSYLDYINIYDRRNWNKSIILLSSSVKIINKNNEYLIPYRKDESKNSIYIYVYKNGININDEDFIIYIGQIQLDTGEIIEIPPLNFKKYIDIVKYNVILDTLNQNSNRKTYFETLENYKKNGWKEEK